MNYTSKIFNIIFPLFLLSSCWGCSSSSPSPFSGISEKTAADRLAIFQQFADTLAQKVNIGDADFFNQHFSLDRLFDQLLPTLPNVPADFKEGFAQGLSNNINPGEQIVHAMGASGKYKLLRILPTSDTTATAYYRLVSEDGINYHEVLMSQSSAHDSIAIDDFYIYLGGAPFKQTIQRLYYTAAATQLGSDSTYLSELPRVERLFIDHLGDMEKVAQALEAKKSSDALAIIEKLPSELLQDKSVALMYLNVAYGTNSKDYNKAIANYRKYYPNDPVLEIVRLDYAFQSQDASLCLQIIDSLSQKVGGDPYLKLVKADILKRTGKKNDAEKLLQQAIKEEPDLEEGYWALAELLLQQKRYDEATVLFAKIYEKLGINPAEFILDDGYNGFWTSAAFEEWQQKHPLSDSLSQIVKERFGKNK